jgi:septum formation protein
MLRPRLILASNSPRRRELLAKAGYVFDAVAPDEDVECGVCSETGPAGLVAELAFRKAANVRRQASGWDAIIVAADTVAECDGMILGKPRDERDARAMLIQLSGRKHRVLTGLCVWPPQAVEPMIEVAVTELRMDPLTDEEIEAYIAGGQWEGKAGGFGYQDRLGWVHVERGSESNVVGLPMELLTQMLAAIDGV